MTSLWTRHKDLLALMFRYGLVGVAASVVHFGTGYVLNRHLLLAPLLANLAGFAGGLLTAYLGHYHYSFRDRGRHAQRLPRFIVTALTALVLHQLGVYVLVHVLHWDYALHALPLLLLVVPMITFLMSRHWVFAD